MTKAVRQKHSECGQTTFWRSSGNKVRLCFARAFAFKFGMQDVNMIPQFEGPHFHMTPDSNITSCTNFWDKT